MTRSPARRQRADARRNRERLLEAAGEVFGERGVDAPLDEVVRRAGVGPATLYRHFPTRSALVEALIREDSAALCRRGEEPADGPDPVDALSTWLERWIDHVLQFRGLAESLRAAAHYPVRDDPLGDCVDRVQATGDVLVDRVRQAGRLRAGVTSADAFDLATAVAWVSEHDQRDARQRHRLLSLMLDALTHPARDD